MLPFPPTPKQILKILFSLEMCERSGTLDQAEFGGNLISSKDNVNKHYFAEKRPKNPISLKSIPPH